VQVTIVYAESATGSENYSSEPPLGPIALYSAFPAQRRSDVRFLDSTVLSDGLMARGLAESPATVAAFSCTTFNYARSLRLAAVAKQRGTTVIFGGIHVTYLRDAILARMRAGERSIDYLVTGYGEPAFGPLLEAIEGTRPVEGIPNLSYVRNGECVINPSENWRHGVDPLAAPLDYSAIDIERYSRNFHGAGNLAGAKLVAPVYTQRGCAYQGSRKCTFCSIEQINPKRPADLFEADLITLITKHNVDHIRINDGDFTLDRRHMASMATAAERAFAATGKRPVFHCFARADEVDEDRIALLKRLNVVSVFIGYESGSDRMLRSMHKGTTCAQNVDATKRLKQHGIDVVCAGFVLGAEGESEETLQETLRFVRELNAIGNTDTLLASPLIPLPGAPAFQQLLGVLKQKDPGKAAELEAADDFNLPELVELWNRHLCQVPLVRVLDVCDEIESQFRIGIRYIRMQRDAPGRAKTLGGMGS